MIRLVTYLNPSELYRLIADDLSASLGLETSLTVDHRASGPLDDNPFATGDADIGFICGGAWAQAAAGLELLGVAPVYDDPRNGGEPVYFAEVVMRRDEPGSHAIGPHAIGPAGRMVYNDKASLTGWLAMHDHLSTQSLSSEMFASVMQSGSHARSMELIAEGAADVATIDATVWQRAPAELRRRLSVVASVGPYPSQPVVVHPSVQPALAGQIRHALLTLHERHDVAVHGLVRYAPVDASAYRALVRR